MSKKNGMLVGVHFNKFTGGPGRVKFVEGKLVLTPRRKEAFSYTGLLTVVKKRTEPFFANHWIQLDLPEGPIWLTCSKKKAILLTTEAKVSGLKVEWLKKSKS